MFSVWVVSFTWERTLSVGLVFCQSRTSKLSFQSSSLFCFIDCEISFISWASVSAAEIAFFVLNVPLVFPRMAPLRVEAACAISRDHFLISSSKGTDSSFRCNLLLGKVEWRRQWWCTSNGWKDNNPCDAPMWKAQSKIRKNKSFEQEEESIEGTPNCIFGGHYVAAEGCWPLCLSLCWKNRRIGLCVFGSDSCRQGLPAVICTRKETGLWFMARLQSLHNRWHKEDPQKSLKLSVSRIVALCQF